MSELRALYIKVHLSTDFLWKSMEMSETFSLAFIGQEKIDVVLTSTLPLVLDIWCQISFGLKHSVSSALSQTLCKEMFSLAKSLVRTFRYGREFSQQGLGEGGRH